MEPTTPHQMQPQGTAHTQDHRLSETTAETQEIQDKEHVYRDKIQQFFRVPVVEGEVSVPVKPVTLTPETPKGTVLTQGEPLFAETPQAAPVPDVAPKAPLFQQLVEDHIARGVLHPEEISEEPTREDTTTTLFPEEPAQGDTATTLFPEEPAQGDTATTLFTEELAREGISTALPTEEPVREDISTTPPTEQPVPEDTATLLFTEKPLSPTTPPEELFISETPSIQENVASEPLSFTNMPAFTVPTEEDVHEPSKEEQDTGLPSPFAMQSEDISEAEVVNEQAQNTQEYTNGVTEGEVIQQTTSKQSQTLSEKTIDHELVEEPKTVEPEEVIVVESPIQEATEPQVAAEQKESKKEPIQEPVASNFVEEPLPEQNVGEESIVIKPLEEVVDQQSTEPEHFTTIPAEPQGQAQGSEIETLPLSDEQEVLISPTEDLPEVQKNEEQASAETETEQPSSTEPDHLDHHIRLGAWEWLYELFVGIDPQKALEKREYTAGELARAEEAFHSYVATARAESTDFEDANAEFAAFTEIFLMEELLRRMEDPITMQDQQAIITQTLNDDFFLFQDARPIRYLLEYVIGQQTQSGQVEYTPYIDYRVTTKRPLLVFMILELIFASFPTENNAFLVSIKDEIYQDRKKYVRFSFECAAHSKIQKEYTARQQLLKNLLSTVRGRFGMRVTDASVELVLDFPFVVKKDEE